MTRSCCCWRTLLMTAGGLLFVTSPLWFANFCQPLKAAPPPGATDVVGGWAGYGREHLQGPQALAGTWYNFGPDGSPDGCGLDGCVSPGQRKKKHWHRGGSGTIFDAFYPDCAPAPCEVGGYWYWMHSPEQERVAMAGLFNRYCIRCHGVDGRGVWDIPGVPDFTNVRWQQSRSNDQIARIIIEGRGAVMPTFRGTLTVEEAWAMARYLRRFLPGTETPRPDVGPTDKKSQPPGERVPAPKP